MNMGLCGETKSMIYWSTRRRWGEWEQAGKHTSGYYPGELPQPNKVDQLSSLGNTETTTKIFLKTTTQRHIIVRFTRAEMKEIMLRAARKVRLPQREVHQTHSRSLGRISTSQKRVGANIQHP